MNPASFHELKEKINAIYKVFRFAEEAIKEEGNERAQLPLEQLQANPDLVKIAIESLDQLLDDWQVERVAEFLEIPEEDAIKKLKKYQKQIEKCLESPAGEDWSIIIGIGENNLFSCPVERRVTGNGPRTDGDAIGLREKEIEQLIYKDFDAFYVGYQNKFKDEAEEDGIGIYWLDKSTPLIGFMVLPETGTDVIYFMVAGDQAGVFAWDQSEVWDGTTVEFCSLANKVLFPKAVAICMRCPANIVVAVLPAEKALEFVLKIKNSEGITDWN